MHFFHIFDITITTEGNDLR